MSHEWLRVALVASCVCAVVAERADQGDNARAERIAMVLFKYLEEIKVQAWTSGKNGKRFHTIIQQKGQRGMLL